MITPSLILVLFVLSCVFIRFRFGNPTFPLDDAYITLHNSLVLAGAPEVNYPGTPALTGATSVLHTVLVAIWTFIPPPTWALFVSVWIGVMLYALGVVRLARVHRLDARRTALSLIIALTVARSAWHTLDGP